MDLSCCGEGVCARILGLDVEPGMCLRLRELGIRPGAVVEVTDDAGQQGRVLALGADRFALDWHTCALIAVEPVEPAGPGDALPAAADPGAAADAELAAV
ncbi:MAG: ferrous iron transport protein A [Cellulomonas sp.]|nr:ferrous iron transport protein A [Cellulomonas sp.]